MLIILWMTCRFVSRETKSRMSSSIRQTSEKPWLWKNSHLAWTKYKHNPFMLLRTDKWHFCSLSTQTHTYHITSTSKAQSLQKDMILALDENTFLSSSLLFWNKNEKWYNFCNNSFQFFLSSFSKFLKISDKSHIKLSFINPQRMHKRELPVSTIVLCTQLKFFSLFHFYDTLTKMFSRLHNPAKLILRQAAARALIPTLFQHKVYLSFQPVGFLVEPLLLIIPDPCL